MVGFGSTAAAPVSGGGSLGYLQTTLGVLPYNIVNAAAGTAKYCGATNTVVATQLANISGMKSYYGNPSVFSVVMDGPTNDLSTTVGSGATAFACYKTAALLAKNAGAKVIVSTITPRTDCTGQCETERQSANTLIRAQWPTFADKMNDLAQNPVMAVNPSTCYSDFVHMTDMCYEIWGGYDLSSLNFFKATTRNSTPNVVASSATPAFDISAGTMQATTLTANITPTFSNFSPGDTFTLKLLEDGTGGYTVTWPTSWPDFINPPTLTTTANAVNVFQFVIDDQGNAVNIQ
jgi:hypothetical protein